jgi:hypothetical protein
MLPAQGDWRERLPHTTIGLMSTGRNEEPIGTSATALTLGDHPHRVSPDYPARAEHDLTMECYEIRLHGHLGSLMLAAFPSLSAEIRGSDTLLRGPIRDQAALHGVLAQVESFGLELIELRRLPPRAIGLPDTGDARSPQAKRGFEHD